MCYIIYIYIYIYNIYIQCGEISDIRLIKTRKGGGGRGNIYSYIEFSDTEPIKQALLMDRNMLNNKPMFVSPFKDGTKETELKVNALNCDKNYN